MISLRNYIDDSWKLAMNKAILVIACYNIFYVIGLLYTFIQIMLSATWGLDQIVWVIMHAVGDSILLFVFLTGLFKAIIDIIEMKIKQFKTE